MVVGVTVSVCQRLLLDNVGNDLCILFLRTNAGQSLGDPMLAYVQNMQSKYDICTYIACRLDWYGGCPRVGSFLPFVMVCVNLASSQRKVLANDRTVKSIGQCSSWS